MARLEEAQNVERTTPSNLTSANFPCISSPTRIKMNDDFPSICESCMGPAAFLKMIRGGANQATCRMCQAPYTAHQWKGGADYNSTHVCGGCSKTRNLCQCCLLDLQWALPSTLRDAVLHATERAGLKPGANETNQRYHAQMQMALVEGGNINQTDGHSASDKLLRIARAAMESRGGSSRNVNIAINSGTGKRAREEDAAGRGDVERFDYLLPEGYAAAQGRERGQGQEQSAPTGGAKEKKKKKKRVLPPKPSGPPPASAFEA